jgi:hypothetical protein
MMINAESLAYWYFRLNGCLTITNFLIHPETTRDSSTEVDILAVRFPYREENLRNPMEDDEPFDIVKDRPFVIIGEVKRGMCDLNEPWTKPDSANREKILKAVGVFPVECASHVATKLREEGFFSACTAYISFFCIGEFCNEEISRRYHRVPQVTWEQTLRFIYRRLRDYRQEKAQHDQWNESGKFLWKTAQESRCVFEFIERIKGELRSTCPMPGP